MHGLRTLSLAAENILVCVTGVFIHSFITIVNLIDWMKGVVLSSTDQILACLGVTRIFFQCSAICYVIFTYFFPDTGAGELILFTVDVSEVFFTYLSFWWTTLLSVVFCLKICNLTSGLFLVLKNLILPNVVHLIVLSILATACYTGVCIWFGNYEISRHIEHSRIHNATLETSWRYMFVFMFGSFAPFLIFFIAAVLLVTSLCLHMSRMRSHSHGTTHQENLQSAIQFVSVCSVYYIVHAIGVQVAFYLYYFESVQLLWLYAITDSLPVLHSIYLILKTAKLRNRLTEILQHAANYFYIMACHRGQDTEPVEAIVQ